jgi:hypothetical protein
MEQNSGGGWAAGGWNSGSCSASGSTVYVPRNRPLSIWEEPSAAAFCGDHLPDRPSWDCVACCREWPCDPAQIALAHALSARWVSIMMSEWMFLAASELIGAIPGELFDRFLLWTRQL